MEVYGEDGETITLKDNKGELKLSDIYNGETASTGSYTKNKEKIEQLENQVAELKKALEDSSKTEGEKSQELAEIKEKLAQTTATENEILKDYTAYKDGKIITGTIENRGDLNWNPSSSTTYTVPAGYYSGGTLSSSNAYNAGKASATYNNFAIEQRTYAFTYTVPYNGKIYIAWNFRGGDNPNSLYCSSILYHNSTQLSNRGGNSQSGFSYNYTNSIEVKRGDTIRVTTNNTAYTNNNTSLCLIY